MVQIHSCPDTAIQQPPFDVVGLWVPHTQSLVILHSLGHMLPSLVGDQVLFQSLVEGGIGAGELNKLLELAHCTAHNYPSVILMCVACA